MPALYHDHAGQIAVVPLLAELGAPGHRRWKRSARCVAAQVIGGRRGMFCKLEDRHERLYRWPEAMGSGEWVRQRRLLVSELHAVQGAPGLPERFEVPAAALATGVVVLADWLVSQVSFIASRQAAPADTVAAWYAASLAAMPAVIRQSRCPWARSRPVVGAVGGGIRGLLDDVGVALGGRAGLLCYAALGQADECVG